MRLAEAQWVVRRMRLMRLPLVNRHLRLR